VVTAIHNIRKRVLSLQPLVHCITNPISINQCANAILAVGARPIMAEHPGEVGEISETAASLLFNLGNITDARLESILIAADVATKRNIPVVLDAVGIACSTLRRTYVADLLQNCRPAVIKGNYSEIFALYDESYKASGVDAQQALCEETVEEIAKNLSSRYRTIILASGKTDVIAYDNRLIKIRNGTPQLGSVTGTGCMLGALCAAYLSASRDIYGAVAASVVLAISGELAQTDKGAGSFMQNLLDKLSTLTEEEIDRYIQVEEVTK